VLCASALPAFAAPPSVATAPSVAASPAIASTAPAIADYDHRAWAQRDGAPPGIWTMAQTPDGWLWLGTATGLFRFDGVSFERHDILPAGYLGSRSVMMLSVGASGDLWVAYSGGGTSVLPARDPLHPRTPTGLPAGIPNDRVTEDRYGTAWTSTPEAVYRLDRGHWQRIVPASLGLPDGVEYSTDADGNLWASAPSGFFRAVDRAGHMRPALPGALVGSMLFADRSGRFWRFADDVAAIAAPDAPAAVRHDARGTSANIFQFDRSGNLWSVACNADAICRIPAPVTRTQPISRATLSEHHYGVADGLSGLPMTLMIDREENIWIGTKQGLDRFRTRALTSVRFPQPSIYFAMVPEPGKGLWIGTASQGMQDAWWRMDQQLTRWPGFDRDTTAAYRDRDGSILLGSQEGFWRFDGKAMQPIAVPETERGNRMQAITRDGSARLWVGFRESPIFRLDGARWIAKGGIAALPDLPATVAVTDKRGRVWFGHATNMVALLNGQSVQRFDAAQGLATATVTAILPDAEATLVGGERGLAAFDGRRFQSLHVAGTDDLLSGVTGLLRGEDGALWINGNAGAVRVPAEELRRALREPGYRMRFRLFDESDGLPGGAQQGRPLPTIADSGDGRLWFAATSGLAWLDQRTLKRNPVAPAVVIRSLIADGKPVALRAGAQLPARVRDVRIGYSALALAMPERIAFRYRLDGYDEGWRDAGHRRDVAYSQLPPGEYTFRVMAANEDGVWSPVGASLRFSVQAAFVQTWGFVALLVLAGGLLLWLLIALRFRQLRHALQAKLAARHDERERIARDLHDTLLQGMQGLSLSLQAWSADAALDTRLREQMSGAATQARALLLEGRDRIVALRSMETPDRDLGRALRRIGDGFAEAKDARFELSVHGKPRDLSGLAFDETVDIAREAIRNAFAHAQPQCVSVRVQYAADGLHLRVGDDGCGIDASVAQTGRPGHWGLRGMRERAAALDAQLDVRCCQPRGTEVELFVPAARAYVGLAPRE
jgi:signal transduction histidine kinase/ligand-binding sensor domain-containing protein